MPPKIKTGGKPLTFTRPPRVGPKTLANLKPTGVGKRGQGAKPPGGGCGGVPFTPTEVSLFERGRRRPTLIKAGVEGAQPHPRGSGGCAPKNFKIWGELSALVTPPRVGPNTLANPEPTRVGKRGARGAQPPWRGFLQV